jgi:uncharacterized protein YbbC (DUF1343 family)/CubicO group peptidase (beta-lactamase class C family)
MKAMHWRCVLAAVVVLAIGAAAFAQSAVPAPALVPAIALALDAAARDAVAVGDVPGAVVVVGQGGSVLYRRATGSRALVPVIEPMTVDTVFDVASLTKVLATMPAVLALWEEGRLDLDAPLGRYLKEFDGPAFREVTLRRLLTHASGLSDLPRREAMARGFPEAAALQAKAGLASAPGSTFVYSDVGFILLAEVVRRVSGAPLDRYVQKRFYGPLGMSSTAFRPPAAWRPRIAPTEVVDGGPPLRGVVHDGNARLLSGVAGHAGLFSTADDLARFCRMLLEGGTLDGHRYLKASTVRAMFTPHVIGETTRGLGWDMSSAYSRTLGSFFPEGSAGHTGFTGPSMWLDPVSRQYVIIMTNRVHPNGKGSVVELRRRVSAAVGSGSTVPSEPLAVTATSDAEPAAASAPLPAAATLTGLDRLVAENFVRLAGRSVGLVTNHTGVDARGLRGVDLLAAAPGVKLRAIFSPEHGLEGKVDANVPHGRDAATGLPVWSLYGPTRRPSSEMLAGIDTLVFDVQDVGTRYYTYLATLLYVLEEAGRRAIAVVVLDRPNPITGRIVEGPVMDADLVSFTAPYPIPVRTGMTIGEFARLVVGERKLPVSLTVVPLENWNRGQWFDQTGLPWNNPSPNIRSTTQALLYSGIGLLEATNLSVGRGTETPFEVIGAPWITNPQDLADALNRKDLPGVRFEPVRFTPTSSVYAGQAVGGVRFMVVDREAIRPMTVAMALGRELVDRYSYFRPAAIQNLLVNRATMWAFLRGESAARIVSLGEPSRVAFLQRRAPYLLY